MKILFKIIVGFLAVVGAAAIALAAYLFIADPFGIKALWQSPEASPTAPAGSTSSAIPNLSPTQVKVLENLGVDVNNLPTITPQMQACFTDTLGEDRVKEIIAGAVPTPMDLLKAKSCLN